MNDLHKDEVIKEEIVRAAFELFQRYGLLKTTMEDIAKAAGKGKSTLYYYYKNKEEIYDAVIRKETKEILIDVQAAVKEAPSAALKLRAYFDTIVTVIKSKTLITDVIRSELKENDGSLSIIGRAKKLIDTSEITYLSEILSYGAKTGEFLVISNEDMEILSYALIRSVRSICLDMLIDDHFLSSHWEKQFDILINIFIKGLKV